MHTHYPGLRGIVDYISYVILSRRVYVAEIVLSSEVGAYVLLRFNIAEYIAFPVPKIKGEDHTMMSDEMDTGNEYRT